MPVHALDSFYLSITLLVTVAFQLSGFAIAYTFQFDKITDLTGGSNFFILALFTLLAGETYHARNIVASVLVMCWAVRIAGFLFFRVLKTGHDGRFDKIRNNFFQFLGFWIAQILWVWIVSLPVIILNSPAISDVQHGGSNPAFGTSRDIAGIVLWALGFVIEATADAQKYRYKSSKTTPKDRPISSGLWAWSRHPPYFGEMMCWLGIWILCLSPTTNGSVSSSARAAQYGAIVSPIFTFIVLMFGSGVPYSAKPQAKRFYLMAYGPDAGQEGPLVWENYKEYLRRTSILIPLPPVVYKRLPGIVKTLLLDFSMYRFDEVRDGRLAIEEAAS
ncbi:DUF1295-domain-containing protein [Roridomyces roridus]|uniref:DUF1295-domain-containing protein n=1 Tax=Roridomyces roridus TaxID=1738132 RepID=A0AAD7BJV5_9AGAR|nr:DUF1295-domain-containing protein [Roridomyces roridus]